MTEDPRTPPDEAELVELIRSIDEPAPEHLHARVQAMVDQSRAGRGRALGLALSGRWRIGWAATAAAAVCAALVLAFTGASATGPTLGEATALTLRGPSMRAPEESAVDRTHLAAAVDGVAFPYWEHRFGWRATGQRIDSIDGRTIRTVFYTNSAGRQIGYAIVAGRPAPGSGSGGVRWLRGTRYQLTHEFGAPVVTWQRDGHMCIVSGHGIDANTLLALASWNEHGIAT
ncbi:MAG TPA: hypothetical protein VGD00_07765 [Solirubrobacteraceae bacterium]